MNGTRARAPLASLKVNPTHYRCHYYMQKRWSSPRLRRTLKPPFTFSHFLTNLFFSRPPIRRRFYNFTLEFVNDVTVGLFHVHVICSPAPVKTHLRFIRIVTFLKLRRRTFLTFVTHWLMMMVVVRENVLCYVLFEALKIKSNNTLLSI